MNEVTPWIKSYFLSLATTHGSDYNTLPPVGKVKKCQLKKVRKAILVPPDHRRPLFGLGFYIGAQ